MVNKLEKILTGVLAAAMLSTSVPQSVCAKEYSSASKQSSANTTIKYDERRFADLGVYESGVYESGKNLAEVVKDLAVDLVAAPQDERKPCPPYLIGKTPECPPGTPNLPTKNPGYVPIPSKVNPVEYPLPNNPNKSVSSSDSNDVWGYILIGAGVIGSGITAYIMMNDESSCEQSGQCFNPDKDDDTVLLTSCLIGNLLVAGFGIYLLND